MPSHDIYGDFPEKAAELENVVRHHPFATPIREDQMLDSTDDA